MLTGILIALISIALVLFARSITTFIHELGHAIPSLLFTKEEVIICVGSYGNLNTSKGIRLGRLKIFFTLNIFNWNSGLCLHQGTTNFYQNLLIIVGGPAASLLVGLSLIYVISSGWIAESFIVVAVFLLVSALWDFISNIIPHPKPLVTHNGQTVYNDGQQLSLLLQEYGLPSHHQKAIKQFQLKKYPRVLQLLATDVPQALKTIRMQQIYITSLVETKQTDEAEELFYHFFEYKELNSVDFNLIAQIKFGQNQFADALQAYNRAIYLDFKNPLLLHQKGWCHIHLTEYEAAIQAFSASLSYQPDFYKSLIDRAYALIKLGELKAAAQDLDAAIQISPGNAAIYFYYGLLKKEAHENSTALAYLLKAKEMGFQHYGLEYYIAEVSD